MIPEYKFFHGAVLAEIVHILDRPVSIDELFEEGRLSSYVLDGRVGLYVKHSAVRLHPWQFTFTKQNFAELLALRERIEKVFLVLVCNTDGMVCLRMEELMGLIGASASEQSGIRIDRRRGQWYSVYGGRTELPEKRPKGVEIILSELRTCG